MFTVQFFFCSCSLCICLFLCHVLMSTISDEIKLIYCSFGQGSSLLWTHALSPFCNRPIALTQEGRSLANDVRVRD